MSQHRIVGSEAFDRRPFVYIRTFKPGVLRRRRGRMVLAFAAGAAAALAAGAATMALAMGTTAGL